MQMKDFNRFYTYAYLRVNRTPYYIGKGCGKRVYEKYNRIITPPKDKSRIIFLKQNLTEEEAFKHEKYMIDVFGRKDLGTGILHNRTDGGEGVSGLVHNEKTRKEMSNSRKGKIVNQKTRKKISQAHKGKVLSEETKKKLSEAHKGKVLSEETKRKLSVVNKGKTFSEETRKKLRELNSGKNNPNYGKSLSEETRKKLSEIRRGKKHSLETKTKIGQKNKGKRPSKEVRMKMSESQKNQSEETRKKRSESMKGRSFKNWQCTETGFITSACALTNYQKARGIDTSKRIKIELK